MAKLMRRATRQALGYLRDLYALRSWDDLVNHLAVWLPTLIPTEICLHNDMNPRHRHATCWMCPPDQSMLPDMPEAFGRVYGRLGVENRHPAVAMALGKAGRF